MGLFDDILGIAKGFGDVKQQAEDALGQATEGLTDVKEQVGGAGEDVQQQVDGIKNGLPGNSSEEK